MLRVEMKIKLIWPDVCEVRKAWTALGDETNCGAHYSDAQISCAKYGIVELHI